MVVAVVAQRRHVTSFAVSDATQKYKDGLSFNPICDAEGMAMSKSVEVSLSSFGST